MRKGQVILGLLVREHNRAEPCRPRANFENHLADNMNTMTRSILRTLLVAAVAIGADAYGHHSSNAAVDAPEPSSNIIPVANARGDEEWSAAHIYPSVLVTEGDTLKFKWTSMTSVVVLSPISIPDVDPMNLCQFLDQGTELHSASASGEFTYTITEADMATPIMYFSSRVGTQCTDGQKLMVSVVTEEQKLKTMEFMAELEKSMTLNSSAFGSAPIAFAVGVMALLAMLF